MKNELHSSLKTAFFLVSFALLVVALAFFLFFGKGLQILMPVVLFACLFTLFFILEKISFLSDKPWLKIIISIAAVITAILII